MMNEDEFVRSMADYYGFTHEDVRAALDTLRLPASDLVVRFRALASFARTYGVNIRELAKFVSRTGKGIKPWEPPYDVSPEDYKRLHEPGAQFASPGDWFHTILALLDEAEQLRADRGPKNPDARGFARDLLEPPLSLHVDLIGTIGHPYAAQAFAFDLRASASAPSTPYRCPARI
jgi:hypothetical protein